MEVPREEVVLVVLCIHLDLPRHTGGTRLKPQPGLGRELAGAGSPHRTPDCTRLLLCPPWAEELGDDIARCGGCSAPVGHLPGLVDGWALRPGTFRQTPCRSRPCDARVHHRGTRRQRRWDRRPPEDFESLGNVISRRMCALV